MNLNQRGNLLVGALVAVGISGIMMTVMTSMIVNANRATQALEQKFEILDTRQAVLGTLADASICGCNLDPTKNTSAAAGLRFDSLNLLNASINLPTLYKSCTAGLNAPVNAMITAGQPLPGTTSGLRVQSITLNNIVSTGAVGSYRGDLTVNFDQSSVVTKRKPAMTSVNFQADISNPSQARITGCQATAAGGAGGGLSGSFSCSTRSVSYSASSMIPNSCNPAGCCTVNGINTCDFCPAPRRRLACIDGAEVGINGCAFQLVSQSRTAGQMGTTNTYSSKAICCD